jgi:soluble lytic murein transglycosylase-like protein
MMYSTLSKPNLPKRARAAALCLLLALLTPPAFAQQEPDEELRQALMLTVNDASSFVDRFDAEVWLVDMSKRLSRYIKDPGKRLDLLKRVHAEASRAGIEPELVLSVIHVESAFDRFAISYVGAQGLMQVMPFWKKEIGRPEDNLTNIATNLRYGCTILRHYIDKEKGNLIRALGRYNGSLGKTKYPEKVLRFWEKYWFVKHV